MASIADDIVEEHRRIADTFEQVGASAPAGVADWTAADLAAHLLSQTAARGLVVLLGRSLIAQGIRLTEVAGGSSDRIIHRYRRHGFDSAVASLRTGPPKVLLCDRVAPVSLFEIWVHHDDLRRANELEPPAEPASLRQAVDFALRYQKKFLGETRVDRTATSGELLRWLAGRPSSIPPHDPPLRF